MDAQRFGYCINCGARIPLCSRNRSPCVAENFFAPANTAACSCIRLAGLLALLGSWFFWRLRQNSTGNIAQPIEWFCRTLPDETNRTSLPRRVCLPVPCSKKIWTRQLRQNFAGQCLQIGTVRARSHIYLAEARHTRHTDDSGRGLQKRCKEADTRRVGGTFYRK